MMKKRFYLFTAAVLVALSITTPAQAAVDLMDIYMQALQNDQTYLAAQSTRLSTQEALPQSIAPLLPQISATADTMDTWERVVGVSPSVRAAAIQAASTTGGGGAFLPGSTNFNSNGYTLTISQTLINFTNWMQVSQASATVKQADATFAAAVQDLIVRTAKAYFDVLLAEDQLAATQAQKAASAKQLDQVQQRFNVGLDAITSVYDARAAYDADTALEIFDQNDLNNKKEALRRLTGQYYPSIEGLKIELPLITPQPADVEQWVMTAEKYNFTYMATRYATQAARANIKVQFGGHLPTLSAVGTYSRNNGQQQNPGTIDTIERTAALQLNLPIYSGGLVASQTRQAEDNYATAAANMLDQYRITVITTRQNYNNVMSGISQLKADRQAIISAQASVDSTEESFKVGTRTIVDVLLALQKLYNNKRVYAQDEYAYINNTLALKQAAGTLSAVDLKAINAWLHSSAAQCTQEKRADRGPKK